MVTIKVLDYYNKLEYYRYMPREIFAALEAAYIDGRETADVEKDQIDKMLIDYSNQNNGK